MNQSLNIDQTKPYVLLSETKVVYINNTETISDSEGFKLYDLPGEWIASFNGYVYKPPYTTISLHRLPHIHLEVEVSDTTYDLALNKLRSLLSDQGIEVI